jgi:hypothetical protein
MIEIYQFCEHLSNNFWELTPGTAPHLEAQIPEEQNRVLVFLLTKGRTQGWASDAGILDFLVTVLMSFNVLF